MSITSIRHRAAALVLTACVAAGLTATAPAQAVVTDGRAAGVTLRAHLSSSGDPDGYGDATFTLNKAKRKVCATASWYAIKAPDAAHLHKQSNGDVVVDLTSAVTGGSHCTKGVAAGLIQKIIDHPKRYYVNVHNAAYPAGAIRGTLHR